MLFKTVHSKREVDEEMKLRGLNLKPRIQHGGRRGRYICAKYRLADPQPQASGSDKLYIHCRVALYSVEDDEGSFHLYINPDVPHEHMHEAPRSGISEIRFSLRLILAFSSIQ